MLSKKVPKTQQPLEKYLSSPVGQETTSKTLEREAVLNKTTSGSCYKSGNDVMKKTSLKSSTTPLILTEMKFANHSNNQPSSTPVLNDIPLDVTVLDIGTPKRVKRAQEADTLTSSLSSQPKQHGANAVGSPAPTVDLGASDSDDEPIAKKIKIDAKKYEKIKKFAPRHKLTKLETHLERVVSAVLKNASAGGGKLPPKKRPKTDENRTLNGAGRSSMPVLKKQQQPAAGGVKQKLLSLKSTIAPPHLTKKPTGAPTSQVKPLSQWIQQVGGKITLKNAQNLALKPLSLSLTRLDFPKTTASPFKIQQKGILLQSPNKVLRAVVPQPGSSGQSPSTSIVKKVLTLSEAAKKLKPLKLPDKPVPADVLAALKARNILISPISRENVVKNNLARLEAKWKACQGDAKAQHNYRQVANVVISILNKSELEKITDEPLKNDIISRYELHHEKQKLKSMNPEERKAYLQQKHKEELERRKVQYELTKVKCEDTEISPASVLPQPTLVKMPEGLSNRDFGDILMVTEFFVGFSELLTPQERLDLDIDRVLQALSAVHTTGFELLTKVIVAFLETLLQTESLIELGTGLEEITVNCYTASELTRLVSCCSKDGGDDEVDSGFDTSSSFNETLNDQCTETLRTTDFYTLHPKTIVDILIFVQNKLLEASNFDEFLREKEEELSEAWKEKMEAMHELKKYKSQCEQSAKKPESGKECAKESSSKDVEKDEKLKTEPDTALSISHFYGGTSTKDAEKKASTADADVVTLDDGKPLSENDENEFVDVPDIDSMLYKVKNRRLISEQQKAKKAEEERVEKERRRREMELQTRENRVAAATKKLSNLQEFLQVTVRHGPLGLDRNYSRYWLFPKSAPGYLFVEKVMDEQNSSLNTSEFLTSSPTASQWFYYNDVSQYENLLSSLLTKGLRESRLHENMQKKHDKILSCLSKAKKPTVDENPSEFEKEDSEEDIESTYKRFLRDEFLSMENKIRHGGLGGVSEFDVWVTRLKTAESIGDFGICLMEIRFNVRPSLLKGIMTLPKKGAKAEAKNDKESEDEGDAIEKHGSSLDAAAAAELGSSEERKKEKYAKQWLNAVKECKTWSRMTVLFYVLNSCIMWEKSVENAPCKICRRRRDEENIILCDECNDCYHIYCLRPPLRRIPLEDWFCVKCKPAVSKKKPVRYVESSEDEEEQQSTPVRNDNLCTACQSGANEEEGEALIYCSSCPCAFHMDCHRPPLRHEPRSGWKCCVCVKGVTFGGRSLRKRRH